MARERLCGVRRGVAHAPRSAVVVVGSHFEKLSMVRCLSGTGSGCSRTPAYVPCTQSLDTSQVHSQMPNTRAESTEYRNTHAHPPPEPPEVAPGKIRLMIRHQMGSLARLASRTARGRLTTRARHRSASCQPRTRRGPRLASEHALGALAYRRVRLDLLQLFHIDQLSHVVVAPHPFELLSFV